MTPPAEQEEARIRGAYQMRDQVGKQRLYEWHRPEIGWSLYRLRAVVTDMLVAEGLRDLSVLRVLDLGCGNGHWLRWCVDSGLLPANAVGVDLLAERVREARLRSPSAITYHEGEILKLGLAPGSFDLVSAMTVLSSILAPAARAAVCAEMARLLAPGGRILIFDFRVRNPANPDVVGITRGSLFRLFPGWQVRSRSLTLAPPLARSLARLSVPLVGLLEWSLPLLRTHAVHLIRRAGPAPTGGPSGAAPCPR